MQTLQWADDVSLAGRNTFRLAARAASMCDVKHLSDVSQAFDLAELKNQSVLVLGEGSNVLFADNFPGLVLCITANNCQIIEQTESAALIRAEAGMLWNELVHWTLARGWNGLENMALIPGTVGACPIQNIGAYGAEVAEFIETVEVFHRDSRQIKRFTNTECQFGYRDSIFKQQRDAWLILAVEFRLQKTSELKINYAGVPEELQAMSVSQPKAVHVAEAISRIRTRKLPNPAMLGNAGSFFKNPMVTFAKAEELQTQYEKLPVFPSGEADSRKLSAAWLIEQSGWKGFREGDAGIAEQHALVLVNYGGASGQQLLDVARRVAGSVYEKFGVQLEPEPRIIGAEF